MYIWLQESFYPSKQIVRNLFKIEKFNKQGKKVEEVVKSFEAKWFYPSEFTNLVKIAGLRIKEILADYKGTIFTGEQDKMIWILSK